MGILISNIHFQSHYVPLQYCVAFMMYLFFVLALFLLLMSRFDCIFYFFFFCLRLAGMNITRMADIEAVETSGCPTGSSMVWNIGITLYWRQAMWNMFVIAMSECDIVQGFSKKYCKLY